MRRKGLLASLILLTVVVVDMVLFGPQMVAVIQEVPRGFHLDVHGIRFHTPVFYASSSGSGYEEYSFDSMPSPTRHKMSMITVDFKPTRTGPPPGPTPAEALQRMGQRLARQRSITLAGATGTCFEYADTAGENVQAPTGMRYIQCDFGPALHARFIGTFNTVEEFYAFVSKAEVLPRKN